MVAPSANLNVMTKAARAAGRALVRDFGEVEQLQASVKGAGDFTARAARRAESLIRDALCEARPNYGWIGAELGGGIRAEDGQDPTRRWMVDALGGVANYQHGLPHWAVSIALEHKEKIVSAVIYDQLRDEMFTAETGAGAWFNDRRLRVSARRNIAEMQFAVGLLSGADEGEAQAVLADLGRVAPHCAGVRRFGATALDLAWVAAGRHDGFWERGASPWETAAGMLLVQEAGGLFGAIGHKPGMGNPLDSGEVLATNGNIYGALNKLLAETSLEKA